MALGLATPLSELRGVGPARAKALADAGYRTVAELLFHLPSRYEDRRSVTRVADLCEEGTYTLIGELHDLADVRVRQRRLSMVRGRLRDETGEMAAVWFNRPYLRNQVREGDSYWFHGRVKRRGKGWEITNPTCEAGGGVHSGRIVAHYPAVGKIGPVALRHLMDRILQEVDPSRELKEGLPEAVRRRHELPLLGDALRDLHRPPEEASLESLNARRSPAHRRLIYGEFFEFQLELALVRAQIVKVEKLHAYRVDDRVREVAREILPFKLTGAQKQVLKEIVDDLQRPYPMLRLLQGDVGSGKTIVAALAIVVALESGLQAAFMAPTEILAEQHVRGLQKLLGSRYRIGLLTGSSTAAASARRHLARGDLHLAVGTHALISEGVEFKALGLAVIDEQHRFGVVQRELLQRKGDRPDVLVMTATPIPRSLALTAYGDLDLSILDELPPGRTPIETRVVPSTSRREVYTWARRRLDAGGQTYVVFPLIDESESVEAASLELMGQRVRDHLSGVSTAVVHGRTPPEERERALQRFAAGEIKVLLATTIIEVGIDVPNADVMIIESAERFGLAQLHQLRGRVGRGERKSVCVAIHGRLSEDAEKRLEVFGETTDGFRIAEADLSIRGPGDLLGTRQAGLPTFRVADIVADRKWLELAREDATRLLERAGRDGVLPLLERLGENVSVYDRFAGG